MNKEETNRLQREDILYDKTQKFGRTQFVRELARLEQENIKLKKLVDEFEKEHSTVFNVWKKDIRNTEKLKDELIKDRMEQLDDYVIFLLDKYLEILGDSNE